MSVAANSSNNRRNYHLDAIRVLAALSVVFTHLRNMLFVPYKDAGTGLLVKLIYVQHYFTRGGVICFFVLSGYLVGNSVLSSIKKDRWSWSDYLVRRLTRLQIVLIPALLLTAIFDFFGSRWSPSNYLDTQAAYSWKDFLGCLVFFQHVVKGFDPFGSNGPLWSLSYEFWYYILFPICALLILRRGNRLVLSLALTAVVWLTFGTVLFLFTCWLGGILAGHLAKRYPISGARKRQVLMCVSALGFAAVTLACGAHKLDVVPADYIFAAFTVPLVWACLCSPINKPDSLYAKTAVLLSEFSYTLYLTHFPFLWCVKSGWLGTSLWKPDLAHLVLMLIPFFASILFAYVCYLVFESNTDQVRKYFQSITGVTKQDTQSNRELVSGVALK